MKILKNILIGTFLIFFAFACQKTSAIKTQEDLKTFSISSKSEKVDEEKFSEGVKKILENAKSQIGVTLTYNPEYVVLSYPNGDVPLSKGVCTDVVIRAMRYAGLDLQKEVHEDMSKNFSLYPKKWGLKKADSNIDHRRVPNLQTFFTRKEKSLTVTDKKEDYKPGDFVTWDLDGKGLAHIGIVSDIWSEESKSYLIIHNIGGGAQAEDRLFEWKITGHYRYF